MGSVVIMSGASGSGKSHYIKTQWPDAVKVDLDFDREAPFRYSKRVVSADFMTQQPGVPFSRELLEKAHAWCFRSFMQAMEDKCDLVVVDNTNTSAFEVGGYYAPAKAMGYEVEVITVMTPIDVCLKRNRHGVQRHTIERHINNLKARILPPWVKNTVIDGEQ